LAKLAAERLEPGMVLAKPVMNKSGMIMLGEGMELNDSLIEKIHDMGIESVHVQGMSQPDVPMEALLAALDARFSHVEKDHLMAIIKRLMKEHIEGLYV
jgi:hypothetical protein